MFQTASTLVLLLLAGGVLLRRRRSLHVRLMFAAFGLDLASVLAIELRRNAIQKALAGPPLLLRFHVMVSITALTSYALMFALGERMRRGSERLRPWHRRAAWVFGISRAANYVTSWMI